jgi:hypothetical protein
MTNFNDPALQQMYEANEEKLIGFTEKLDRLSADIRNLESVLNRCPFERKVAVPAKFGKSAFDLVWTEKRIQVCFDGLNFRPLMECKLEIRLIAEPYLPILLKLCIEGCVEPEGDIR